MLNHPIMIIFLVIEMSSTVVLWNARCWHHWIVTIHFILLTWVLLEKRWQRCGLESHDKNRTWVKSDDFRLDLTKSKKTCHNQSLLLKPFDLKVLDSLPQAQSMLFKQINDAPTFDAWIEVAQRTASQGSAVQMELHLCKTQRLRLENCHSRLGTWVQRLETYLWLARPWFERW